MTGARKTFVGFAEPYLPGKNRRPDESEFAGLKAGLSPEMPASALAQCPAFLAGVEAIRHGYYWEAHELLEAVWTCLPPASAERHLLRGLIQLANAGLKARMGRQNAALRILAMADNALAEAGRAGQKAHMNLGATALQSLRQKVIGEGISNSAE